MTDETLKYTPIEGFDPAPIMLEFDLTLKQTMFAEWYLVTLNGSKAARLAGYSEPYYVSGSRSLSNAKIRAYLEHRYAERKITPSAILDRLIAIAEADISDYLIVDPTYATEHEGTFRLVADGRVLDGIWIDLRRAMIDGRSGVVKSIKKVRGETVIELHDKVRALELLGKHYRLFADVTVASDKPDGTADELSDEALNRIARQALDAGAAGDVSIDGGDE